MSRWFRMYADVLDDPKVQKLPPDLFKAWVNLLCLASRNDGVLPDLEDIAFALRMSQSVTRDIVVTLTGHGLLDEDNGLSPHNWAERQFKSDTPESATERKRRQRQREKQANVTHDVTACHSDSHSDVTPPEQSRTDTEQSRAEQTGARSQDPKHWEEVQGFLKDRLEDLTDWEVDFLHSVKWSETMTQPQRDSLKTIRDKLTSTSSGGYALPSVSRGTAQYDAWVAYHRAKNGGRATFHESRDSFTVLTEWPPEMEKAA